MQSEIILLFIECVIHCIQHDFVLGNPMFGPNVRNVQQNEFPYVVSIMCNRVPSPNFVGVHICTGLLITRKDVLTAAHCLENAEYQNIQVSIGSIDLGNGSRYETFWWMTYNQWATYLGETPRFCINDIANLRLLESVPADQAIALLSNVHTKDLFNKQVLIAAWGRNDQDVIPERMRTVNLKVLESKACTNYVRTLDGGQRVKIHHRHICTLGNPYAVMHHGDSGGPVIYLDKIVAIHKATIPFPGDVLNPRKVNVHTTIDYYREFLSFVIHPDFDYR